MFLPTLSLLPRLLTTNPDTPNPEQLIPGTSPRWAAISTDGHTPNLANMPNPPELFTQRASELGRSRLDDNSRIETICWSSEESCDSNWCIPIGYVCCSGGFYCNPGDFCGSYGMCTVGGGDDDTSNCPTGQVDCDGYCIPSSGVCCELGSGYYCDSGEVCVAGTSCCPEGTVLCGQTCIPEDGDCCNTGQDTYCDSGYYCQTSNYCCPNGQTCNLDTTTEVDDPATTTSVIDGPETTTETDVPATTTTVGGGGYVIDGDEEDGGGGGGGGGGLTREAQIGLGCGLGGIAATILVPVGRLLYLRLR